MNISKDTPSNLWVIQSDYSSFSYVTSYSISYNVQLCYLNFEKNQYCSGLTSTSGNPSYDVQYSSTNYFNSRPYLLMDKNDGLANVVNIYLTRGQKNYIPVKYLLQ